MWTRETWGPGGPGDLGDLGRSPRQRRAVTADRGRCWGPSHSGLHRVLWQIVFLNTLCAGSHYGTKRRETIPRATSVQSLCAPVNGRRRGAGDATFHQGVFTRMTRRQILTRRQERTGPFLLTLSIGCLSNLTPGCQNLTPPCLWENPNWLEHRATAPRSQCEPSLC